MKRAVYHKLAADTSYPLEPPFDPPKAYPEFDRAPALFKYRSADNAVYDAVRDLLERLGLDRANIGTAAWNPFGDLVSPGQNVVIKPNLVLHSHPHGLAAVFSIVTHPAVVRAVIDYVYLAVGEAGRITVGDTPLENCEFSELVQATGLAAMVGQMVARGMTNLELLDFRTYATTAYPDGSTKQRPLPGDPRGYTSLDLAGTSLLQQLEDEQGPQNYYTLGDHTVDHLDPVGRKKGLPNRYHFNGTHIYRIPNTVLDSDLLISVAKLKTHKFSGVTLSLKNMVGITQGKEYLPHRRPGTPLEGGDSFPVRPSGSYLAKIRLKQRLFAAIGGERTAMLRRAVHKFRPPKLPHEVCTQTLWGDWDGNDTIWRSTLDLNVILFHGNRNGIDLGNVARRYFAVIDGIVGMDHEAPMMGVPVDSKLLIMARDPVAADTLATYLMGFDPAKISTIAGAAAPQCSALGEIALEPSELAGNVQLEVARCSFVPTKGWKARLTPGPTQWPWANSRERTMLGGLKS